MPLTRTIISTLRAAVEAAREVMDQHPELAAAIREVDEFDERYSKCKGADPHALRDHGIQCWTCETRFVPAPGSWASRCPACRPCP